MLKKLAFAALASLALAAPLTFSTHPQILHSTAPLPSFEIATIRPWQPPAPPPPPADGAPAPANVAKISPGAPGGQSTDRVHFIGQVAILLESAYNLPISSSSRIVGAPDWVNSESDRYEIQAKIDPTLFASMQSMTPVQQREQVDLMEQSLLADRFKLVLHFETRNLPVYALVVAKGGPTLTPAKQGEVTRLTSLDTEQGSIVTANSVTLDQFVHSPLLRPDGRAVFDQTGLQGAYDFTLKFASPRLIAAAQDSGANAPSLFPVIFTAIQEQLGLKLVPSKAPAEVIVIDHIEKPSEN